jgi:hypothetical protein
MGLMVTAVIDIEELRERAARGEVSEGAEAQALGKAWREDSERARAEGTLEAEVHYERSEDGELRVVSAWTRDDHPYLYVPGRAIGRASVLKTPPIPAVVRLVAARPRAPRRRRVCAARKSAARGDPDEPDPALAGVPAGVPA